MEYRISLTGDLGSGKSTVGKIIADQKGCEMYSTGKICRAIAQRLGIDDIKEMNVYMKTHPEVDKQIDDGLVALSDRAGNLIVDSRMAWHFTKPTFKTYLTCSIDVAADRIFRDGREGEKTASVEAMKQNNRQRKQEENGRYFALYGVNIYDMTNYDLVVDTTEQTPETVAKAVIAGCEAAAAGKPVKNGLLCPLRLIPTASPETEDGGEITVTCIDNVFYILSGHEAVLEAAKRGDGAVGCRILPPPENTDPAALAERVLPAWETALAAAGKVLYSRA